MTPQDAHSAFPNPLIAGFNPDPSCVLVDGAYYLVTSSFEYLPALPVYRSTDFAAWEHIGNVATREEQVGIAEVASAAGVWAPTIRYHNGLFHVIVTVAASPRGCVVFTAADPAGPWSDGVALDGILGIDPDLAWDDEGTAYVTYSGLHLDGPTRVVAHRGILQARVDIGTGKVLEEPRELWSGTGLVAPEAPHVFRRGDHWYLLIAEGGTGSGHAVSIARGDSIEGPFEGAPHNPILTAAGKDLPVQCTGHADLVPGPHGGDVLVLLGTRQAGKNSPLGRETYVTTVEWTDDGWPNAAMVDLNSRPEALDEYFDFAEEAALADPGWLAVGRPPVDVASHSERPGYVTLHARSGGLDSFRPDFVGRRQRHIDSVTETRINPADGRGGLGLRFDEEFTIALTAERAPSGATLVTARAGLPSVTQTWSTEVPADSEVLLRIVTQTPPPGRALWLPPGDRIRLSVVDSDGVESQLVELDGRMWSVELAAPFTGRVIGMFAEAGTVHFADFRYHGEGNS
ncbi:glycoside hydrolase family 43 protein [Streptomyces dysideae]|uniref:Glycoside hydrolase n=1 Tax=Streptomyces dysideae TaxID=909626 RepID=A0A117S016_9ACTN|nr:glycoside hydrolase family 43 protein [Streptomyces dysideae]KUO18124.1 glycoside hydrolase [Streptomyces dysideae]